MKEKIILTRDIVIEKLNHDWKEIADNKIKKMLSKNCSSHDGHILNIIEPIEYEMLPLETESYRSQFRATINVERYIPKKDDVVEGKITKISTNGNIKNINICVYGKQLVLVRYIPPLKDKSDNDNDFIFNGLVYTCDSMIKIKIIHSSFQELNNKQMYTFVCVGKLYSENI